MCYKPINHLYLIINCWLYIIRASPGIGEAEEETQILHENDRNVQTSTTQKFRRSFHKYTGTVIRSPLDKLSGVNPPRRLLRNDSIDGKENHPTNESIAIEMTEFKTLNADRQESVETSSTTTNASQPLESFV